MFVCCTGEAIVVLTAAAVAAVAVTGAVVLFALGAWCVEEVVAITGGSSPSVSFLTLRVGLLSAFFLINSNRSFQFFINRSAAYNPYPHAILSWPPLQKIFKKKLPWRRLTPQSYKYNSFERLTPHQLRIRPTHPSILGPRSLISSLKAPSYSE